MKRRIDLLLERYEKVVKCHSDVMAAKIYIDNAFEELTQIKEELEKLFEDEYDRRE